MGSHREEADSTKTAGARLIASALARVLAAVGASFCGFLSSVHGEGGAVSRRRVVGLGLFVQRTEAPEGGRRQIPREHFDFFVTRVSPDASWIPSLSHSFPCRFFGSLARPPAM